MELSNIPGLGKNLARVKRIEDSWRERAFLPVGVTIHGVDCLQLTLRHMTILMEMRLKFLDGMATEPEDVGMFLWVVSPHYRHDDAEKRQEFLTQLVQNYPPLRFRIFYRAIYRYVWQRALMDIPPTSSRGTKIATCFAAGMVNRIAHAYGWSIDTIMDTPIAALYQLWKWIDAVESDERRPQFNPLQDAVMQRHVDRMNGRNGIHHGR